MEQQTTSVCRFFTQPNGCFRGNACTYSHENTTAIITTEKDTITDRNETSQQTQLASTSTTDTRAICRFYTSNTGCRKGSTCRFSHSTTLAPSLKYYRPGYNAYTQKPTTNIQHRRVQSPYGNGKNDENHPSEHRKQEIHEVMGEITPVYTRDIQGPFFAIDVECVATGTGTNDRDVARIAVVDADENVFFDQYVKPEKKVVSYLTQLTGITEEDVREAENLTSVLMKLKKVLPISSVIVGQSIKKDLDWLMLEKGKDYKQMFDVADLFRIPLQSTNGTIRYRYFSLRHVAKHLLGHDIQEADHDPVIDAKYAMKIFNQFRHLHENIEHRHAVFDSLLKTPRTPSFAERFPVIDGVEMRPIRKKNPRDDVVSSFATILLSDHPPTTAG